MKNSTKLIVNKDLWKQTIDATVFYITHNHYTYLDFNEYEEILMDYYHRYLPFEKDVEQDSDTIDQWNKLVEQLDEETRNELKKHSFYETEDGGIKFDALGIKSTEDDSTESDWDAMTRHLEPNEFIYKDRKFMIASLYDDMSEERKAYDINAIFECLPSDSFIDDDGVKWVTEDYKFIHYFYGDGCDNEDTISIAKKYIDVEEIK